MSTLKLEKVQSLIGNDVLNISESGRFTAPNQPVIELNGKNNADVDFTANTQLLTSTHYNQTLSRGGMSWDSSTGRVTVPVSGVYFISMFVYCNSAGNGEGRIQIRPNGTNRVVFHCRPTGTNTATLVFSFNAGEYVDVIADGFDLPRLYMGDNHTRFNMFLLG